MTFKTLFHIIYLVDDIDSIKTKKGVKTMKINKQKLELAMANAVVGTKQLSDMTGIAPAMITRIKNGRQQPRPVTLGKIAKALDVKVEDLVD